eukprot:205574-Prorocentrum_minimum.AAC.1
MGSHAEYIPPARGPFLLSSLLSPLSSLISPLSSLLSPLYVERSGAERSGAGWLTPLALTLTGRDCARGGRRPRSP